MTTTTATKHIVPPPRPKWLGADTAKDLRALRKALAGGKVVSAAEIAEALGLDDTGSEFSRIRHQLPKEALVEEISHVRLHLYWAPAIQDWFQAIGRWVDAQPILIEVNADPKVAIAQLEAAIHRLKARA